MTQEEIYVQLSSAALEEDKRAPIIMFRSVNGIGYVALGTIDGKVVAWSPIQNLEFARNLAMALHTHAAMAEAAAALQSAGATKQ